MGDLVVAAKHDEGTNEIEFEILEIEFYLQIDGCHKDPFTHGSVEQEISGSRCLGDSVALPRHLHVSVVFLPRFFSISAVANSWPDLVVISIMSVVL
jgi:hypothetical protein